MKTMKMIGAALALIGAPAHAQKKEKAEHVYGPEPTWEEFRTLGEAAITAKLIDPDSAKITWLGGYQKGGYKPFLQGKVYGYFSCGTVNARNRMGGYTGATHFVVVYDYGNVLAAEVDGPRSSMNAEACRASLRQGLLPPVPTSVPAAPSTTAVGASAFTVSSSGLTLQAMPDGAYVSAVAPRSVAEASGLKPGMVINSVNAVPLKGMGDAMLKVIEAAGDTARLTIVGGTAITLELP